MVVKLYWWRSMCNHLPPWYYGYVRYDMLRNQQLFALIPFNWLLRAWWYLQYKWDGLRGLPPRYELIQREVVYNSAGTWGDRTYIMFPYELRIGAHVLDTLIPAIKEIGYMNRFTLEANQQLKAAGIPYRYKYDASRFTVYVTDEYGEKIQMEGIDLTVAIQNPALTRTDQPI